MNCPTCNHPVHPERVQFLTERNRPIDCIDCARTSQAFLRRTDPYYRMSINDGKDFRPAVR